MANIAGAALNVQDLIGEYPEALKPWLPTTSYLLIDEGVYPDDQLAPMHNLVAAIFQLENSQSPEILQTIVRRLLEWLATPELEETRRSISLWLTNLLLPEKHGKEKIPEMQDLQEVQDMLAERVKEWEAQWMQEGLEKGLMEGRQKGLQEGRTEGERLILLKQLVRRFGPLPEAVQERIKSADATQLELWAERILDAITLESVFQ